MTPPKEAVGLRPLDAAKLMLDAKVVIGHYNHIISLIPPEQLADDGDEADFVMTVYDYHILRDYILHLQDRYRAVVAPPPQG